MDSNQLGRLLDQHAAALELYARQWCDCAEDVVQEAFLRLSSERSPPDNPAAWLFRVVRNRAIDASLAARRRRRHEADAAVRSPAWFEGEGAEDSLDGAVAADALGTLPIEQREIIVAHLWGGLTFQQIAGVAGCSSSTAHRLYIQGLSTLRERLGVPCPQKTRPTRS